MRSGVPAVPAVPRMDADAEIWAVSLHPFAPEVAPATGEPRSTWELYGMRGDSAGKHGLHAPISWSGG